MAPRVSVVIVTRDRPARLRAALDSLRAQTLAGFEIVVVDDGSREPVRAQDARVIRRDAAGAQAVARNHGWRAARAPLVAFMDDDCRALPGWLEAGLAAWAGREDRVVQGQTTPDPLEGDAMGPFSYTYDIRGLAHELPTCNIFYPRALLERLGGFDPAPFAGWGEDTDLGWRAREAGAEVVFAPAAEVHHAVVEIGPRAFLRRTFSQGDAVWLLRRHPGLRRARLSYRLFWNPWHFWVLRAWAALPLARRRRTWPLALWLALPWLRFRRLHPRTQRPSPSSLAWFALADTVEVAGIVKGAVRHRTPVL